MARITREGFETCMAFGTASLAVAEVAEFVSWQLPDGPARALFAEDEDAGGHAVALSILVLADRMDGELRQGRQRPGM
jgi:hypothetical protein